MGGSICGHSGRTSRASRDYGGRPTPPPPHRALSILLIAPGNTVGSRRYTTSTSCRAVHRPGRNTTRYHMLICTEPLPSRPARSLVPAAANKAALSAYVGHMA